MENTGNTLKLKQDVEESSLRKMYCRMYLTCSKSNHLFCYRTDSDLVFCRLDHWNYVCDISEFEVLMHKALQGSSSGG